ncbi:putative selenium-dependent hydroxylase accessory protein YqeC [Desulfovibrio sp. OttesenSCG-928-C14]|nr:putative selenium-dependent hydroxylase accessory protein YqeC [Desulfovibrio sp. OttesenSCG-928-C14]
MEKIQKLMGLEPGRKEVAAISGSGGKTTLLKRLSLCFPRERVLCGATTRLAWPDGGLGQCLLVPAPFSPDGRTRQSWPPGLATLPATPESCRALPPGRYAAGLPNAGEAKLESLAPETLRALLGCFDKVILECDGSRCKPLKGWAGHEPVPPPAATLSVGVIPPAALGLPATKEHVHRLPLFLEQASGLAPLAEGEEIRAEHLAALIAHPAGLFKGAQGRKILFFSQVEDEPGLRAAEKILEKLPARLLGGPGALFRAVAGSARENQGIILWQQQ